MAWLVRDGDVLASANVAATPKDRRRGLLGLDGYDGALVLRPCRHLHTFFMRFTVDAAFCDRDGVVLRVCTLRPWRLSPVVRHAAFAVEAEVGAFERWRLRPGDRLEVKE